MSDSVRPHKRQPTRLPRPWDSPGKNTGVGCHFLLQCMKVKVKSLHRVRLLVTPRTAACQAPLSMGFSRQEYWSGLPFSSPGDLSNPGIKPRSPTLQADSLPAEPQGKSKNTGVGSLALLQGIFPTQELNQGVLHCRWILYQLSYQGSHSIIYVASKK